jgi:simple sugar transport system permease protein
VNALSVLLFAAATLRITVPYALAAAGASLGERGGVVCLGLEGFMLNSALAYVLGAWYLHNPWLALLCSMLAGVATAGLHALVTVTFRADQITSGIGINLLAAGLTRFVLVTVFHSSSNSPRVPGLPGVPLGPLSDLPALGPLLETPLVLIAIAIVPAGGVARVPHAVRVAAPRHRRAAPGERRARARGRAPARERRDALRRARRARRRLARERAALLHRQHDRRPRLHRDRGDDRGQVAPGRSRRGVPAVRRTEAAQIALQGSNFPSALLQALPYAVTMLALAGFIGRATPPRALGTPYDPEGA